MTTNNGQPRPAPIASLHAAEGAMITQLNAVADRLDSIGQADLQAAVARAQASAAAAQARLAAARDAVNHAALEVVTCLDLMAAEIAGELAADAAVQTQQARAPGPKSEPVRPAPGDRFTLCEGGVDPFGMPILAGDVPLLGVPAVNGTPPAGQESGGALEAIPEPVEAPKPSARAAGRKKRA